MQLEYSQASWSPWHQADIDILERMVSGMGHMSYPERLAALGLTTPQARRERWDTRPATPPHSMVSNGLSSSFLR